MLDELFASQIRRTTRNGLLLGSLFLGVTLTPTWYFRHYVLSVVRGPVEINEAQLASSAYSNPFLEGLVKVHGSEIAKTGAHEVARDTASASDSSKSNRVIAHILALKVGDHFLLAKVPVDAEGLDLSGELVELPQDVRNIVITKHLAKHPELAQLVCPYLLDSTKSRFGDPWTLLLGTFFFVLGVVSLARSLRHVAVPASHPLIKGLGRYGDPGNISIQIGQEMRMEGERDKFGNARITSNWLVDMSWFKTSIIKLSDVLWAYPKVIKHYHNFIPTGKSYFVVVRDRAGQTVEVSVKKDQPPAMLQSLSRRVPWALYGFDKQVENIWTKNRAQLTQLVEKRKASLSSESKQPAIPEPVGVLAGKS